MHDLLLGDIDGLLQAATDLESAAPAVSGRGWDASADADALQVTKAAWTRARSAYEQGEGGIAPLFPDIDRSIDARYDDFLTGLAPDGDADPFDGKGVTGMHAIERILWADETPARVVEFEKTLPGYLPAAVPATPEQSTEFKSGLCDQLVKDTTSLRDQWHPIRSHIFIAYQGLVALMNEQREKVRKAASNEEESRYAQTTMADIRDNLAGTKAAFALFEPWLLSKKNPNDASKEGPTIDLNIQTTFRELADAYASVIGDALPSPPVTWSSENPTAADLTTPFGKLFSSVESAVDPNDPGSVVAQMGAAATLLGFGLPGA
jgi:iron uptake system component EfeO